ncbi:hypothetical protein [Candidatus Rhabdochlamydia porcellionis]|jgi:hypothetical protein|uniref:Uncharacterized protein n=1 Tax=Candidatus Rhabdochlamydia porcellionis TaxID=225148 RepID=A0ABX8YY20_9BACT|nr:hypothetical protein [Candidatus Rhabdochlamydia porcellionis]QZA58165.1 hypothetical protein RHAB15C_0000035 [Candidatus Rhabdochlamydia porcellionis]
MDYVITQSQRIHKDFVNQMTNEGCSGYLDSLDQAQQEKVLLTNNLVQAIIQKSTHTHGDSWSKNVWDRSF